MIADSQLSRERRQLGFAGEEAVGAAFDDVPFHLLGHNHSARAALGLQHRNVHPAASLQLPRRRKPGDAGTHDHNPHRHPRPAAAERIASATAATNPGSSLRDGVRWRCMPSRRASV